MRGKASVDARTLVMGVLQRWREVYGEAVLLTDAVQQLPEECECGDADSHLAGACRCCERHRSPGVTPAGGPSCTSLIERLRASLLLLHTDLSRVADPLGAVTHGERRVEILRETLLAEGDLQRMLAGLERLLQAVVGFRRTCALSEIREVKRHGAALREHCDRVHAALQSQT